MREKIEDLKENINLFWQRSTLGQKMALASLISFAILTPIISLGILSPTNLRSRAFFPVTQPVTPPSPPSSLFGKAIRISDPNAFVNVAPSLTTLLQTNFTVEAWVKITNNQYMNDTNPHYILAKETADGEAPGYALAINNRKAEFRIFLIRDGQKPVNLIVTGKTVLNFDQWYHIAGVKMANTLYLLVDGKLESTAVIDQGGYGYERGGRNLTFGCVKIINFPACIGNFYGEIDEVRLSRTARIPKNPFPPQTPFVVDEFTQALWHFDGDVNDISGNNNHGKIFGNVRFVNSDINPSPITTPTPSYVRVFVTSISYNGNLGGLEGADNECQKRANAANLGGTWKAFLSTKSSPVDTRLIHFNGRYLRLDGVPIANDWASIFTNLGFTAPLNITELRTIYNGPVWTGAYFRNDNSYGPSTSNSEGAGSCNNWTSAVPQGSSGYDGYIGLSNYTGPSSIGNGTVFFCSDNKTASLYCFEQIPSPTLSPITTPTPTPTLTPTLSPTPTSIPIFTPTPTSQPTKTPTPQPTKTPTKTPTPTKKPTPTLIQKYHSECRRFLFSKYCVLVKGPGINQCRTSRDCR